MAKQQKQVTQKCGGFENTSKSILRGSAVSNLLSKKDQGREGKKSVRDEEKEKEKEKEPGVGQEGDRGEKMNHIQTLLVPRELYWSSSKESVSGNGNNNSAHCERRQERS